jgi:hypothetical protein
LIEITAVENVVSGLGKRDRGCSKRLPLAVLDTISRDASRRKNSILEICKMDAGLAYGYAASIGFIIVALDWSL